MKNKLLVQPRNMLLKDYKLILQMNIIRCFKISLISNLKNVIKILKACKDCNRASYNQFKI